MKLFKGVFAKFILLFFLFSGSMEIYGMNKLGKVLFGFAFGGTVAASLLLSKGKLKIKHNFSGEQTEDLGTSYFELSEEVIGVNGVVGSHGYTLIEKGAAVVTSLVILKTGNWFVKETIRIGKLNANTAEKENRIKKIKAETRILKKENERNKKEQDKLNKETQEYFDKNPLLQEICNRVHKNKQRKRTEMNNDSSVTFEELPDGN